MKHDEEWYKQRAIEKKAFTRVTKQSKAAQAKRDIEELEKEFSDIIKNAARRDRAAKINN